MITNVSADLLQDSAKISIITGSCVLHEGASCYASVAQGQSLAIIGSRNVLEISVNGGSAAATLGVERGEAVRILLSND